MENHQRQGKEAGGYLGQCEKREKHKIGHCKDFKKTTRLVRKCKTVS